MTKKKQKSGKKSVNRRTSKRLENFEVSSHPHKQIGRQITFPFHAVIRLPEISTKRRKTQSKWSKQKYKNKRIEKIKFHIFSPLLYSHSTDKRQEYEPYHQDRSETMEDLCKNIRKSLENSKLRNLVFESRKEQGKNITIEKTLKIKFEKFIRFQFSICTYCRKCKMR